MALCAKIEEKSRSKHVSEVCVEHVREALVYLLTKDKNEKQGD